MRWWRGVLWGHKDIIQGLPPSGTLQPQVTLLHAAKGRSHASHTRYPALQVRTLHGVTLLTAGFIDFIVEPTFSVLTDVAEKSVQPLVDEDSKSKNQPRWGWLR